MANVTHSDFWPSPSDSDPPPSATSQAHVVPTSNTNTSPIAGETPPVNQRHVEALSQALCSAFSGDRDQLLWRWMTPEAMRLAGNDQRLMRVDPQHVIDGPLLRAAASRVDSAGPHLQFPWLVVVDDARRCVDADYLEAMGPPPGQRLLLVACEDGSPASVHGEASLIDALASAAQRLGWNYLGPINAESPTELPRQLAEIKSVGRPTILHVATSNTARNRPHFTVSGGGGPPAASALQALARLAETDGRVLAICTSTTTPRGTAWEAMPERLLSVQFGMPSALHWCAESAAGGSRPFVLLRSEELLAHLDSIRESICRPGAAVTLIVEAQAEQADTVTSPLNAVRHLENLSVLAPMDGGELSQMLAWCASQDTPAVVWLSGPLTPDRDQATTPALVRGTAARLASGDDVAIVAWGMPAAAACQAARLLAERGLTASVLSLRFAQPLDVAAVVESARNSACVVLVDGAARGGIGSSVLEELAHAGITQPVSIVTIAADSDVDAAARAIVERCQWLAEPIVANLSAAPVVTSEAPAAHTLGGGWLTFFGQHQRQMQFHREQVVATQLSADVQRWVTQYQEIGSRDLYLWKWCRLGAEITTLPSVVPQLRAHVCDTKVLSIVLCVLLDDVADQHGNGQLLDALLEMTCSGTCRSWPRLNAVEKRHAEVARAIWTEYQQRIAQYPRHAEFAPVLQFDLQQFFNTMRYSYLVNGRPYLLNMTEHDLYTSHNMMMISFGTLDLMCSPDFPLGEVSPLREMLWHAQNMGRIGNLLSTWLRELAERDFTSGVFARALRDGDLTLEQLQREAPAKIEATIRGRGHVAYFYRQWQEHRERCHALAAEVRSQDLSSVLEGHDRFFAMHLGSQGLI